MNKIVNKDNNKVYDIFDVTYDKAGYPHFLIYKENEDGNNGQWVRMSAKHFRTYTVEDWEKEIGEAKTTLQFATYDC